MQSYQGKSVFEGIAMGRIRMVESRKWQQEPIQSENIEVELARYRNAVELADEKLNRLYDCALREVGNQGADIFQVHRMLLRDAAYVASVEELLRQRQVKAEYAVSVTGEKLSDVFACLEDETVAARAADIKDITEQLLEILAGLNRESCLQEKLSEEAAILVAEELSPSEMVQIKRAKVAAVVMTRGSETSHSAILARMMGIPTLVRTGLVIEEIRSGELGAVDGFAGMFYVQPDREVEGRIQEKMLEIEREKEQLRKLIGRESVSADGKKIQLYANIGNVEDLTAVLENDAEGIGLFRSEFIYLNRESLPTEEEQFQIYKTIAEKMAGKSVIIRTLDIGGDKQCPYLEMEREENPALGCRGIRFYKRRPEILKTQLRALLRASVYGNIEILYPMITTLEEVHWLQAMVEDVKKTLDEEKTVYGNPKQGIMIETPAAVMLSRELAEQVDFFSIGTNDLTQYTLAVDRYNSNMTEFIDPHHSGMLRMIEWTVKNAHAANIPVGICGELGADMSLTEYFLKIGIDELSVTPDKLLPLRKHVRELGTEKRL